MTNREVLFEIVRMGNSAKVMAIDSKTMVEVTVVGSAYAHDSQLRAAALQKLKYVLAKRANTDTPPDD